MDFYFRALSSGDLAPSQATLPTSGTRACLNPCHLDMTILVGVRDQALPDLKSSALLTDVVRDQHYLPTYSPRWSTPHRAQPDVDEEESLV